MRHATLTGEGAIAQGNNSPAMGKGGVIIGGNVGGDVVTGKKGQPRMSNLPRSAIRPGMRVRIVQKQDQRSGKLTEGVVKDILTNSATHPHGIKVRLEDGRVGRVKEVVGEERGEQRE